MDSRRNEIKVGIAVLLSLVILVGGIMWGKGYSLRAARYNIVVVFENVGGLEPGSNVLANGVVQGRVTGIELHEGKVFVRAAVDKGVTLYSDYRITIESPTVMAGKVLSIYPGEKEPPADVTQILNGQTPLGVSDAVAIFEEVSADFQTTLHTLNKLLVNLNRIAGDTANQENIAGLLAESREAAQTTNEWLSDNRARLTSILTQLEETLTSLHSTVETAEARLTSTLTSADTALTRLTELSVSIRRLVDRIQSGEGTAGQLVTNDELYHRLNRTLAEADSLIHEIRTKGLRNKIVLF
ncbi:MCE family protein [bacterium]|nr:MCE family protein [bacterium]MBU1985564.1 MCE family protein [bacterium]